MIVTCRKHVSRTWIALVILPWAATDFTTNAMAVAFLFSLKKFLDNPAGLTFLLSLPQFFSLIVGPACNALSDTAWTRYGRRKPFVIVSWAGRIVCIAAIPLAPNWWVLVGAYLFYCGFCDIGGPLEVLKQEVVPPQQRGRATAAMTWVSNLVGILFYSVALGRFDDVSFMAGFPVTGEDAIYWISTLFLLVMLLLVMLGIKETPQPQLSGGPQRRFSAKRLLGAVFTRTLWPIYGLIFARAMLNAGLGPLGNLISTEQFGFSKQDMGNNVALGGVINIFIIGFLATVADKFNRLRAYQVFIVLLLVIKVLYYWYIEYVLVDGRATVIEAFVFGEAMSILGTLTTMVYTPLVYDYVRRDQMGSFSAGSGIVGKLTGIATLNGVGLFIWAFATLFRPPAGEMTRVVITEPNIVPSEIRRVVDTATWTNPFDHTAVPASQISATPWYATNVRAGTGSCWELRLRDPQAEGLAKEREMLAARLSELALERSRLVGPGKAATTQHSTSIPRLDGINAEIGAVTSRRDEVTFKLDAAAADFREQVRLAFGDRILDESEQITCADVGSAVLVSFKSQTRPNVSVLDRILRQLRAADSNIIDLVAREHDGCYFIECSSYRSRPSPDANRAVGLALADKLAAVPELRVLVNGTPEISESSALRLQVRVVEDPIDLPPSPIMRGTYRLVRGMIDAPPPDRRITAIARSLRFPGRTEHVRLLPASAGGIHQITLIASISQEGTALISPPPTVDPGVSIRLATLLPAELVPAGTELYGRLQAAADSQRLTLARPFVASGYATLSYDYMSGYLWTFLMACIGLVITFWFAHQEKNGHIHKAGVDEANAEATTERAIEATS